MSETNSGAANKPEMMTYSGVGVDYGTLDEFKRHCQLGSMKTARNIERLGYYEIAESRGESAYLVQAPNGDIYAHVDEGLGTKNIVARKRLEDMHGLLTVRETRARRRAGTTERTYFDNISQCTVAMIVNDMITLGALPLTLSMHFSVGDGDWFKDKKRAEDLVDGWARGANLARCSWGLGETPALRDLVSPSDFVLSGSSTGVIRKGHERRIDPQNIQDGDAIMIFHSSGIHANGLTLCRSIGDKLKDGYETKLPDGRTYGETLLDPTHIYVGVMEDCMRAGVDIHYAVNVTGHGWRKFMRANQPFTYVIDKLPPQQPIFNFIMEEGPMDIKEAYGNLNMGAGFAIYVPQKDVELVQQIVEKNNYGFGVTHAGHIENSPDKKVLINPVGLVFKGDTLAVRAVVPTEQPQQPVHDAPGM